MFKYEGNRMAVLSCNLLAKKRAPFTALYIYGSVGCGKTTLLNYLESEVYKNDPQITIARLKTNDLNNCDWSELSSIFKDAKSNDIVMIEDFNTINNYSIDFDIKNLIDDLHFANKKIVITGNKKFEENTLFSPELVSRMKWEMHVKITPPSYEDCLNALREVGQSFAKCSPQVLEEIYKRIVNAEGLNLGNILSTLRRIVVRAEMNNIPLSVDYAIDVIYDGAEIELIGA